MISHMLYSLLAASSPTLTESVPPALALEPVNPLIVAATPVMQDEQAERAGFSYTYIEANYLWFEPDAGDDNLDGYEIKGSIEIFLNLFLQAAFSEVSDDFDVQQWKVGLGWHLPIGNALDLYGLAGWAGQELDFDEFEEDQDDDGPSLAVGARFWITPKLELNGEAEWADVEDSEAGFGIGGRWYFNPNLSLGLGAKTFDSNETFNAGLRFSF